MRNYAFFRRSALSGSSPYGRGPRTSRAARSMSFTSTSSFGMSSGCGFSPASFTRASKLISVIVGSFSIRRRAGDGQGGADAAVAGGFLEGVAGLQHQVVLERAATDLQ